MSLHSKIFVSYHSSDRTAVQGIVSALKAAGHPVWWDQDLCGHDLAAEILRQIRAADVVLVLVSRNWLGSEWCKGEAEAAGAKKRIATLETGLIPLLPPPMRARNILDLAGYDGSADDVRVGKVIEACRLPSDTGDVPAQPAEGAPVPAAQPEAVKTAEYARKVQNITIQTVSGNLTITQND